MAVRPPPLLSLPGLTLDVTAPVFAILENISVIILSCYFHPNCAIVSYPVTLSRFPFIQIDLCNGHQRSLAMAHSPALAMTTDIWCFPDIGLACAHSFNSRLHVLESTATCVAMYSKAHLDTSPHACIHASHQGMSEESIECMISIMLHWEDSGMEHKIPGGHSCPASLCVHV